MSSSYFWYIIPLTCTHPSPFQISFSAQWDRRVSLHLAPLVLHFCAWEIPAVIVSSYLSACRIPILRHFKDPECSLHTLVLLQPSLYAASCANNSPNPSINPFTNGRNRLMAAPLNMLQNVGGWYKIIGDDESEGGSSDESFELE